MLKKTAKKNAFNSKLMSLALATGITAQAVPFTTHLLPNITQNVLAHADDNQSENFSYTLQTKDENGKVVVSDKITFTKNDDGTYKVTDEAGLLKPNTNNVKIDDMMNIQLNNLIDSTKELNWISQNGQYKLADNHESATPDDQGNLTFAVVKNTTNKDNGGNSDSTAPTTQQTIINLVVTVAIPRLQNLLTIIKAMINLTVKKIKNNQLFIILT